MKLLWAALLWTTALCFNCPADTLTLELQSDEGDFIGRGENYSLTYDTTQGSSLYAAIEGRISGTPAGILFIVDKAIELPAGSRALLSFGTRMIPSAMQTGTFTDAQRYQFETPGHPGLSVGFNQWGCNTVTGGFTINELRFDNTALLGFSATFEQHCDGFLPALRGTMRYERIPVPDITVATAGITLQSGATVSFEPAFLGGWSSRVIRIESTGNVDLTGLEVAKDPAGAADDFRITTSAPIPGTLARGQNASFNVYFYPSAFGQREVTLRITSSDPDENPFTIHLSGNGQPTPLEAWRLTYFQTAQNSGPAADTSDPDNDGIVNLMEFATITDPLAATGPAGQLVLNGNALEYTYTRLYAALAIVRYDFEFSDSLTGPWNQTTGTASTVIGDGPGLQVVKVTVPAGTAGRRFVRLRVTRP